MELSGDERIVLERVHQLASAGEPTTAASVAAALDRQIGQTGFTDLEGEPSVLVTLERLAAVGMLAPAGGGTWRPTPEGHRLIRGDA